MLSVTFCAKVLHVSRYVVLDTVCLDLCFSNDGNHKFKTFFQKLGVGQGQFSKMISCD